MYRIGFIGKQRAGKDEAGNALIEYFGGKILKFADPIYETEAAYYKALGIPIPRNKQDRRYFFLGLGKLGRSNDSNTFVDALDRRYRRDVGTHIYVTDVRFRNEAAYLYEQGFTLVKIECDDELRKSRGAANEHDVSEVDQDTIDSHMIAFTLRNDHSNSLEDWHRTVQSLVLTHPEVFKNETVDDWRGTLFQDIGC